MNKVTLRYLARRERLSRDEAEMADLDRIIADRVAMRPEVRDAAVIMAYVSCRGEVDTHGLIRRWLDEGRTVCVPQVRMAERRMEAVAIGDFDHDLAAGAFGILGPRETGGEVIAPERIDLVITPGLLFDRQGRRLGQGGGFYDRFLAGLRPDAVTMAPAYPWQVVEGPLPAEGWDVRVGIIVTPTEMLMCS